MFKATLSVQKEPTENKIIFSEVLPEGDMFATRTIPALYIDKRDVSKLGFSQETPRLEVTIKAVAK
jgi:hypothetical protein